MTREAFIEDTRRRLAEARELVEDIKKLAIVSCDVRGIHRINGKATRALVLLSCVEDELPKPATYSRPPEEGD